MKKRYYIAGILTICMLALTYKFWLIFKTSTHVHFEFFVFTIILILSYLFTLKLTDFLADFKSLKHQSRIEIVFLFIFFLLLFIPMAHINKSATSERENRTLAVWKPLINEDKTINYNFGKDFDEYFNDRFNQRNNIISSHKLLKMFLSYKIYHDNNLYYNKKTGWAFDPNWINKNDITPNMHEIVENIKKLYEYCNKNNIKLYIVTAPVKEEIYDSEMYPFKFNTNNAQIFTDNLNIEIPNLALFPIQQLKNASKVSYTYPKSDPHWSEYGGYIVVKEFLKFIKKDFPGINQLSDNDFVISDKISPLIVDWEESYNYDKDNPGYYYKVLNLKNKQYYKSFRYKYENKLEIVNYDYNLMIKNTYLPVAVNNQKVFIIGTSYSENFYRFMKYAFKYVIKRKINNLAESNNDLKMNRWTKDILKQKPDILVIVVQSNDLDKYKDLWKE